MNRAGHFPGFGSAALLCGGVVLLQVGLMTPFAVASVVLKVPMAESAWTLCGVNLAAFGLVVAFGVRMARAPVREAVPLRRLGAGLLVPVGLTILGSMVLLSELDNRFRSLVPVPAPLQEMLLRFTSDSTSATGTFVLLVIVAPVTEEALFRGVILRGLLSRFRVAAAVGLSAVLFALTHLNPWQMASAAALGSLFGWWRVRTGSVTPGLLGHVLANAVVFGSPYLPWSIPGFNGGSGVSGSEFQPLWFNLVGLVLMAAGCGLFHWMTPQPRIPPVLADPPGPATVTQ